MRPRQAFQGLDPGIVEPVFSLSHSTSVLPQPSVHDFMTSAARRSRNRIRQQCENDHEQIAAQLVHFPSPYPVMTDSPSPDALTAEPHVVGSRQLS